MTPEEMLNFVNKHYDSIEECNLFKSIREECKTKIIERINRNYHLRFMTKDCYDSLMIECLKW